MAGRRKVRDKTIAAGGARVFDRERFPDPGISGRSAAEFLADTPAAPLSMLTKGMLGAAAVVVALLLIAAVLRAAN